MSTTYKQSGVNIKEQDKLIEYIKKISPSIGGFSGLFQLKKQHFGNSFLVASCDGVGTKLKLAFLTGKHDTVGIDLVAMCVNDIITCGAKPLFFLDYFAYNSLKKDIPSQVIKGISQGCKQSGCVLLGGETAQMPGFYRKGEYDLAGFGVGIVQKDSIIDGSKIMAKDIIIGLPSSGVHSNGFSLIRKIFSTKDMKALSKDLLKPTRIYVNDILSLKNIKGLAHITGGGLIDNIPRILPDKCQAVIRKESWNVPKIFTLIKKKGMVSESEMYHVFNMGIGMVMVISPAHLASVFRKAPGARVIGEIIKGDKRVKII